MAGCRVLLFGDDATIHGLFAAQALQEARDDRADLGKIYRQIVGCCVFSQAGFEHVTQVFGDGHEVSEDILGTQHEEGHVQAAW